MKHIHTFESFLNEAWSTRALESAGRNLAGQVKGQNYTEEQLRSRLDSMPLGRTLKDEEKQIVIDTAKSELGMTESEAKIN